MKTCARCGAAGSGLKCPSCGLLLIAPPSAAARVATVPLADAVPAPPSADEQYFAPATVTTVVRPPAPRAAPSRVSSRTIALIGVAIVAACVAAFQLVHQLTHTSKPKVPVVLPARAPSQGLPSSLEDVVRIQAESARQHALSLLAQARGGGAGLAPSSLASLDASLKWLPPDRSSTRSTEVSMLQGGDGTVTIAISASSKSVCAYAQLPPVGTAQYVTMGNVSTCRAADAPTDGWSPLRGGSASDLPPDGY